MERTEEILEIVREIRSDISYMKRHRNLLCGVPILEVGEVCDLLKYAIVNFAATMNKDCSRVFISVVGYCSRPRKLPVL